MIQCENINVSFDDKINTVNPAKDEPRRKAIFDQYFFRTRRAVQLTLHRYFCYFHVFFIIKAITKRQRAPPQHISKIIKYIFLFVQLYGLRISLSKPANPRVTPKSWQRSCCFHYHQTKQLLIALPAQPRPRSPPQPQPRPQLCALPSLGRRSATAAFVGVYN